MDSAVIVAAIGAVPLLVTALMGLAASRRAAQEKRGADLQQERREAVEAEAEQRAEFAKQQAAALADERRENARLRAELAAALKGHAT